MRMIGSIGNKKQAEQFGNYLFVQGIQNRVTPEEDGSYGIWVYDESRIPIANQLLSIFLENPQAPEFRKTSRMAGALRGSKRREDARSRSNFIDVRTQWHRYDRRIGPLTLTLIAISVGVGLLTGLGHARDFLQPLLITNYQIAGNYMEWQRGLPEIAHGQVWRLITPIFIHFGFLHLLFNMLWLKDLGTIIEQRQGSLYLGIMVLTIGILSNVGQYLVSGPSFGGMSGVVYGLLGYMWIRGKLDPASGLSLNQGVVTMMILWFFLCLTGLVGNVANTAHAAGLASGMAWGFISAKLKGLRPNL